MAAALSVSLLPPANPRAERAPPSTCAHPDVGPAGAARCATPLAGCGLISVSNREDALPGLGRHPVPVEQFTTALIQAQLLCHPLLNPRCLMIVVYFHAAFILLKAVTFVSKVFVITCLFYNLTTVIMIITVWANALSGSSGFSWHTHTHASPHTHTHQPFDQKESPKGTPLTQTSLPFQGTT